MALLGIAAVHWPRAQQPGGVRTVGVFIGLAENDPLVSPRVATLRQGLADLGWIAAPQDKCVILFFSDTLPEGAKAFPLPEQN